MTTVVNSAVKIAVRKEDKSSLLGFQNTLLARLLLPHGFSKRAKSVSCGSSVCFDRVPCSGMNVFVMRTSYTQASGQDDEEKKRRG